MSCTKPAVLNVTGSSRINRAFRSLNGSVVEHVKGQTASGYKLRLIG